ncbi:unnamed protein product [Orchesella dallaii]|uniref:Uncharacterized protein n=1 Tax=Orchesella dallaii TaxID=48710 RepID=A0ABP1QRQ9_9HEXA
MGAGTGCIMKRNYGYILAGAIMLLYILHVSEAREDTKPPASNDNSDTYVPHVRYRTRPVAAFRSTKTSSNNSSETDGPEASGVPFIAVHELTSQTFDKLHENWRNLESIIRNLQTRQPSKEDTNPSSSSSQGVRENVRRPPLRNDNVYTLKYHPVAHDSEGSTTSNDGRVGAPSRTVNGNYNFSPFPYDVRGQGSKNVDMERHTVATIYTIGICLAIMAIGSVMFILINKCDGTGGNSYVRTAAPVSTNNNGNRIARGVIGAATRAGRQISNGRNRSSRPTRNNENNNNTTTNGNASSSVAIPVSGVAECDAKVLSDLPPSYDSLFPEGGPKPQEVPPITSTTDRSNENENIQIQITTCPSTLQS